MPHPDRAAKRAAFLLGVKRLAPSIVGTVPFALITGVAGVAAGLTPFETLMLSVIAFSGIAQLIACQLLAAAAPIPVIWLAVFTVSLRLIMYSAALAPYLGHLPTRWKLALAYVTTDQAFAYGIEQFQKDNNDPNRHWFHIGGGLVLWFPWQIGVAVGALAGTKVPADWSLDFAVPLTFLAVWVPALKTRPQLAAAVLAGAVALACVALPFRLGLVIASVVGIVAGAITLSRQR